MTQFTSILDSHYCRSRLQARLNSYRAVIARGKSPSSSIQKPKIKKQKLLAGNQHLSRETNNAEDLVTQR